MALLLLPTPVHSLPGLPLQMDSRNLSPGGVPSRPQPTCSLSGLRQLPHPVRGNGPERQIVLPQHRSPAAPQASQSMGRKECLGTDTVRLAPQPGVLAPSAAWKGNRKGKDQSLLGSITPDCIFFFFLLKFLLISLSQQPTQCGPLPRRYQRHFE